MAQDWKGLLLKVIQGSRAISVQWEAKAYIGNIKIRLKKDKEFVTCVAGNRNPLTFLEQGNYKVDSFLNLILIKVLHVHIFKK